MKRNQLAATLFLHVTASTDKVLAACSVLQPLVTKAHAYRMYGRSNIDRWIAEGLLLPAEKNGSIIKDYFDTDALANIANGSNRVTYLPVAER